MRRIVFFCAAATSLFVCLPARADESDAERLFREGRGAMLEGRLDEACPKIAESQRLDPHVGTLLNLAACHEKQGKVGSAWVEYEKALTTARAEGQTERAKVATQRIAAIEPRVPWLRIAVALGSPDDLTVTLDGGTLADVAYGKEMPVDPGIHSIEAHAAGKRAFSESIDMKEGTHRSVTVELTDTPPAPSEPVQPPLVVEPTATARPKPPPVDRSRWEIELGLLVGVGWATFDFVAPEGAEGRSFNSPAAGVNVFAGYKVADRMFLGGRLLAGVNFEGGNVVAIGPSLTIQATSALTVGGWAFAGDASMKGTREMLTDNRWVSVSASGGLHGAFGLGIEVALRLFELPSGEIIANATPFFLAGANGTALYLPVGLAYRFR